MRRLQNIRRGHLTASGLPAPPEMSGLVALSQKITARWAAGLTPNAGLEALIPDRSSSLGLLRLVRNTLVKALGRVSGCPGDYWDLTRWRLGQADCGAFSWLR
jgi:hypothetical protein